MKFYEVINKRRTTRDAAEKLLPGIIIVIEVLLFYEYMKKQNMLFYM